jgi:hypothetical protein
VFGGTLGLKESLPPIKGFKPGRIETAIVSVGLFVAALSLLGASPHFQFQFFQGWYSRANLLFGGIFVLRAVVGLILVGIMKKGAGSAFYIWETRLYEPLCLALAISFWMAS